MKEKRILCVEVSSECQHLMDVNRPVLAHLCECSQGLYCTKNIYWKPISKDACKNCKEGRYQGFTREQTIRKMADAIQSEAVDRGLYLDDDTVFDPHMFAEAALNALLEANNGVH